MLREMKPLVMYLPSSGMHGERQGVLSQRWLRDAAASPGLTPQATRGRK